MYLLAGQGEGFFTRDAHIHPVAQSMDTVYNGENLPFD